MTILWEFDKQHPKQDKALERWLPRDLFISADLDLYTLRERLWSRREGIAAAQLALLLCEPLSKLQFLA